jgi:hypothetical protein
MESAMGGAPLSTTDKMWNDAMVDYNFSPISDIDGVERDKERRKVAGYPCGLCSGQQSKH